ncbi:MAG TPA: amino acid permease [Deltaproteobacteria bacterium]|nr:amino acid permease [Deltaproteobacteria bacterium]
MADPVHEHDKQVLHKLGYAQELARRMSGFSNFAISFSIICVLAGGISSFPAAFNSTGGGGVFVGWLLGGLFALLVSLSMGQIASAYPTAGGLYHWGSILGGKFCGWVTAWFNLLGLVFVVSSVDVYLYLVFFKGLLLETVLHVDTSGLTMLHQHLFVAVCLVTQALLNHFGIKLTTALTDLSGYLIFTLTVILIVALFVYSPVTPDFSRLVTFTNYTGAAGGGVIPKHTSSLFLGFFFGLIYVMYTITGFDASGHTSEETHDAQVNVPKGMWTAVFYSWILGLVMVAAFVLAMPNLDQAAGAGFDSFFYMWSAVAERMPKALEILLAVGLVTVNYICALAGLTSTSRMMYAFARDGGLPASGFLSHVSVSTRAPTYAIWTAIALAFLATLYADAFLILATGCAVFLYISYIIPVLAGFFAEGRSWKEKGPFRLGIWSRPVAILAATGVALLATTGFFPPNQRVFYLTVAMAIVLPILWFAGVRKRFEGVPVGERIQARQKMIAEIEKKYGP